MIASTDMPAKVYSIEISDLALDKQMVAATSGREVLINFWYINSDAR